LILNSRGTKVPPFEARDNATVAAEEFWFRMAALTEELDPDSGAILT